MAKASYGQLSGFLSSSIGKKQIMGLTGLALSGFLLTHMLGNFLLLVGKDAFNLYAHTLTSNPAIYLAEAVLVALFLTHFFIAMKLTFENKKARPQKYFVKTKTGRGSNFASSTMPYTGMIIMIFLVLHLLNFKYGTHYTTDVEGKEIRDIYRTVIEYFQNPFYTAWYVFAMITIAIHLSHGFQSAFQSLGFRGPDFTPKIKKLGLAYSVIIGIGFGFLAIWCHLQN
jgi:succinate dehydrogenase / fumarate reductase cytochrome b subunit